MTPLKTRLIFSFCLLQGLMAWGQKAHQQVVNQEIEVTLLDSQRVLTGFQRMEYINRSPDTLSFLFLHLWANAFQHDSTAYAKQTVLTDTRFYFSSPQDKGRIYDLNFRVNGRPAALSVDEHPDVAKLFLPRPMLPGDTTMITTPFKVKLPALFSRGGSDGYQFSVTQWYVKPAVYTNGRWHEMPYLEQGEGFGEFGNFKVTISLPKKYVLAAPGIELFSKTEGAWRTASFALQNAHDFVWFANPRYHTGRDTIRINDRTIDISIFYLPSSARLWRAGLKDIKEALKFRSGLIGDYPYESFTAVEAEMGFAGGMEYPAITSLWGLEDPKEFDLILQHEIGHNWFSAALASNERKTPWMDEGMNTYYDRRYERQKYGSIQQPDQLHLRYLEAVREKTDQPISLPADAYSNDNYAAIVYHKAALWMEELERLIGRETFDSAMRKYYDTFRFSHPGVCDFQDILESVTGKDLVTEFELLHRRGTINSKRKRWKPVPLVSLKETEKYHFLSVAPALGLNVYDRIMPGILLHNYTLPRPPFQFLVAPLYSFQTKSLNGIAHLQYDFTSYGKIRKLSIALDGSTFHMNQIKAEDKSHFLRVKKIVPQAKVTFRSKTPDASPHKTLQWKSFLIREEEAQYESLPEGELKFSYGHHFRSFHELQFLIENPRPLYPYHTELKVQKGRDFLKLGVDANYYFNYTGGNGLSVRLFAGKFIYTTSSPDRRFRTARYHLNMTGPNGYEDYTYGNYFVGRNQFEGAAAHQIMMAEGGLKMRTDLLNQKPGKSDNLLAAMNINTPLPKALDPLSLLPFPSPLRMFADIGTSSPFDKNSGKELPVLFDAGVQLSFFKNVLNIDIPLVYSRVYQDYYRSTFAKKDRFAEKISFSLDIQKLKLKDFF